MNDISDLEALVTQGEPEPPPDNSALGHSKLAFTLGILLVDTITSYTVWQMTGYWYYGAAWFLAGAIAFFLHLRNWERPGSNSKQEKNALTGIALSVGGMLVIGISSAVLWVMQTFTLAIEGVLVGVLILLFFTHLYLFAKYYFMDDSWVIKRQKAKAKANANKHIELIKAADDILTAEETALEHKNKVYRKHGDRGAVNAALKNLGDGHDKKAALEVLANPTHPADMRREPSK